MKKTIKCKFILRGAQYKIPQIKFGFYRATRMCIAPTVPSQDVRPSVCHTPVFCLRANYQGNIISLMSLVLKQILESYFKQEYCTAKRSWLASCSTVASTQ